ncbi:acyltransferase [Massilia sp. UMI-21]|nr:acyltransferase [Massilia sp. UMI-21]
MPTSPPALGQPFSLYLDLTRLLAALLVVASHFEFFGAIPRGAWGPWTHMGREAVIVFFVLSGYVIAATTDRQRLSGRAYAAARLSRVYSVALPVLLLALASALAVRAFTDIAPPRAYMLDKAYLYLLLHLLFLGQHWTLAEVPSYLVPYWSLGYEAWYYLLFGLACYLRGARRAVLVALTLALMGYKLWLLLPVWLAGAWLSRGDRGPRLGQGVARGGWLATLLLFGAWVALDLEAPLRAAGIACWPFPSLPLGSADRFLGDYLVGAIVLANFACARDAGFTALLRIAPAVRLLASYTFTLYLSHALVIRLWLTFYPHQRTAGADLLALATLIGATTFALGAVTERRRHVARALFARLLAPRRRPADAAALAPSDRSAA